MFDIGFFELILVAVVALLVIGPERLPKVARTAGLWIGKGKGFLSSVKQDIDRELKAEELKRILNEQAQIEPLHEIMEDTKKSMERLKKDTEAAFNPDAQKPAPKPEPEPAQVADDTARTKDKAP